MLKLTNHAPATSGKHQTQLNVQVFRSIHFIPLTITETVTRAAASIKVPGNVAFDNIQRDVFAPQCHAMTVGDYGQRVDLGVPAV